jgi:hypothetical protein
VWSALAGKEAIEVQDMDLLESIRVHLLNKSKEAPYPEIFIALAEPKPESVGPISWIA